jgi:hypothetical protein
MTSLAHVAVALTAFAKLSLTAGAEPLPAHPPAARTLPAWEQEYRARCEPYQGDPSRWLSLPPSKLGSEEMAARFSHCSWTVSADAAGGVFAALAVPRRRTVGLPFEPSVTPRWRLVRCAGDHTEYTDPPLAVRDFLAVPGGFLVGYNSGEFGGGLFRFNADGRFVEEMTSENVVRIVADPRGPIVFTGIAHLGVDRGEVLRISHWAGRWRVTRAALPSDPRAILAESDGSFLVVTAHQLVRVTQNLRAVVLHHGSWGGHVAPTSIVRDSSGTIYVGMRYAVARLRMNGRAFAEEWLVPPGPQSRAVREAG